MTGKAIYALLIADATVLATVSTRIFPDMATQDAAYPFLIYTVDGTSPSDTKEGPASLDTVDVSVMAYATKYTDAQDLAEAVRGALDRKTGTIGGLSIQEIRFAGHRSVAMDWDKHIYIIHQEYQVRQNW